MYYCHHWLTQQCNVADLLCIIVITGSHNTVMLQNHWVLLPSLAHTTLQCCRSTMYYCHHWLTQHCSVADLLCIIAITGSHNTAVLQLYYVLLPSLAHTTLQCCRSTMYYCHHWLTQHCSVADLLCIIAITGSHNTAVLQIYYVLLPSLAHTTLQCCRSTMYYCHHWLTQQCNVADLLCIIAIIGSHNTIMLQNHWVLLPSLARTTM